MRFKQFIQEDAYIAPSTREITADDITKFLVSNPKAFAHIKTHGFTLFRGMNVENSEVAQFGDSRIFKRKAANTYNFVNVYLPTVPTWKEFPSRQSAFICSTDKGVPVGYGHAFYVVPADDARIGVCSADDFWFSFDETLNEVRLNIDTLNRFIFMIGDLLKIRFDEHNGLALRRQFSKIDADEIEDCFDVMDHSAFKESTFEVARIMKTFKLNTLDKFMDYALDAKFNNFKVANDLGDIPVDREAWVSGEVIFIPMSQNIKQIISNVEEK